MAKRPRGVVALGAFFVAGAAVGAASAVSLAYPGGLLEPMWRLKPEARHVLAGMGPGGIWLMTGVAAACALAAVGLWRGARWGWQAAVVLLAISTVGDVLQATLRGDPAAWIGVPIALLLLAYLWSGEVKSWFGVGGG